MAYHGLLRIDEEGISVASYILGEDSKNQLATLFNNHLSNLRDDKYGIKFKTADDFMHSKLDNKEKDSLNSLLEYELNYL
jgi:hypothetical protein